MKKILTTVVAGSILFALSGQANRLVPKESPRIEAIKSSPEFIKLKGATGESIKAPVVFKVDGLEITVSKEIVDGVNNALSKRGLRSSLSADQVVLLTAYHVEGLLDGKSSGQFVNSQSIVTAIVEMFDGLEKPEMTVDGVDFETVGKEIAVEIATAKSSAEMGDAFQKLGMLYSLAGNASLKGVPAAELIIKGIADGKTFEEAAMAGYEAVGGNNGTNGSFKEWLAKLIAACKKRLGIA